MSRHDRFMGRALDLARRGQGRVEPNPMVGAVLAHDGRVIAEGRHAVFGGAHAEVDALRRAAAARPAARVMRRATLYVTLEPCTHFGKTPPCAPFVIESGVRRVVIASRDPNPVNAGRGVAMLRRAGVEVIEGVRRREAEALNAPFFKLHRTGLPWVIAKWAMSADGRIATRTGDSRWITGPGARAFARRLRARCQAVVVGIGTAIADDPGLLPDPFPHGTLYPRPYVRTVLDSLARIPLQSRLVRSARRTGVLVAVSSRAPARRCRALARAGCEVLVAGRTRPELPRLLREFGRRGFTSVMIEGGGAVLGSAFDARAVDEVYAFMAARVIGGDAAPGPVGGTGPGRLAAATSVAHGEWVRVGTDMLLHGRFGRTVSGAKSNHRRANAGDAECFCSGSTRLQNNRE